MRSKDAKPLFYTAGTDMEQCNTLFHIDRIHLISGFQTGSGGNHLFDISVTRFLCQFYRLTNTFPLRFSMIQKRSVCPGQCFQLGKLLFIITFPCIFSFHTLSSFLFLF